MRRLLEQALADVAVGLSSGLTYTPGSFADTRELHYLVAALDGAGLGYHTHLRNYSDDLPAALDEALAVTANPSVPRGGSVPVEVRVTRTGGFTGPIRFELPPLPAGVSALYSVNFSSCSETKKESSRAVGLGSGIPGSAASRRSSSGLNRNWARNPASASAAS